MSTREFRIFGLHDPYLVEYSMFPYLCDEVLKYYNNVYHGVVSLNSDDEDEESEEDYKEGYEENYELPFVKERIENVLSINKGD